MADWGVKFKRGARQFLFVLITTGTTVTVLAQKQSRPAGSDYPNKSVRIVVGSSPGGGADIVARLVAPRLADSWGIPVVIENRSAGAVYGLETAGRATPDGYTIGFAPSSGYSAAVLSIKLPFDLKKNIDPLVQLTSLSYLLITIPSVPGRTVKDLIEYARTKPGVLNYGSTGHGAASHLGMELFNLMAGTKMVHVPFKGAGPVYVGLLGGEVQVFIGAIISSAQHVKSGKLKALAVTGDKRSKLFADLPTVNESGMPGFDLSGWYGLIGPVGMPPSVIAKIHQSVTRVLVSPDFEAKIAADGSDVVISKSPAEFRQIVAREIEKWEKFRKATGISLN